MKDKISANLFRINWGGFGRIKTDEVCCEKELLGIMGLQFPHMTSQFPHFYLVRWPCPNAHILQCACV